MTALRRALVSPLPALRPLMVSLVLCICAMAHAEDNDTIATDRPDFVESSDVVGNGRFQIEAGLALERTTANGFEDRTFTTPTLFRYGIGDLWELRLETDGRTSLRSEDQSTGASTTINGYSELSLGAKYHLTNESEGVPSTALLLHFDIPSGSQAFRGKGVRPSLRAVAEWELPNDLSLGVMPGLIYNKNDSDKRFVGGILGIVLGKSWNDHFRTFVELAAPQITNSDNGGTVSTLDIGGAYLIDKHLQIDAVVSKGLNKNTADLAFGVGLSIKF